MIRADHVDCVGEKCIENSGRNTCRKGPLVTHMPRLEDNIKMDLKEREWEVCWLDSFGSGKASSGLF
jgi:hypothetical protein